MSDNRCTNCDRPLATPEMWDTHASGCECDECLSHCYGGPRCLDLTVNWRERCRGRDALLLDCRAMLDHLIRLRPGRVAEYPGPESGWRDTPEARAQAEAVATERGTAAALADNAARDSDRDDYKALRARIGAALGEV